MCDKRFHKNVKFVIFIMINCYDGGSQEDDTQVEGEGEANEFFFTKNLLEAHLVILMNLPKN